MLVPLEALSYDAAGGDTAGVAVGAAAGVVVGIAANDALGDARLPSIFVRAVPCGLSSSGFGEEMSVTVLGDIHAGAVVEGGCCCSRIAAWGTASQAPRSIHFCT